MRFNLMIADCDKNGVPVGSECPECGIFVGRTKLVHHRKKCNKRGPYGERKK